MSQEICRNFMRFNCNLGEKCKYLHPLDLCAQFWNSGKCKYGENCKKRHEQKVIPAHSDVAENIKVSEDSIQKSIRSPVKQTSRTSQRHGRDRVTGRFERATRDKHEPLGDRSEKTTTPQRKPLVLSKSQKNTVCWTPVYSPLDARILVDTGVKHLTAKLTSRDILLVPNLFSEYSSGEICKRLISELNNCGVPQEVLKKKWHGHTHKDQPYREGTHEIVNSNNTQWKQSCPTYLLVLERIRLFFGMDIKADRFNLYSGTTEWKPFHHDSSYLSDERASQQNFTVALNFTEDGHLRSAAFEHATTQTRLEFPLKDGDCYCFSQDTNAIWRHGILAEKQEHDKTRVSIIAWGFVQAINQV